MVSERAAELQAIPDSLPGFCNAQAWYGEGMGSRTDWIFELSVEEKAELRQALRVAQASGRELHCLERAHFQLDRLARR